MSVSEARLAANRANAKRSKGPTSEAGRRRSSLNSLKHGLCSKVVLTDDEAEARETAEDASDARGIQDAYHRWLASQAAVLTARIDRSVVVEKIARDRASLRAEVTWDNERRLEVIRLAKGLAENPEEVAEQLRGSYRGCEWMLSRWSMLAYNADQNGGWTPEQLSLAFDLLGTPAEFRGGPCPGVALDLLGRATDQQGSPAELARREGGELMGRLEQLANLDEADRAVAGSDLGNDFAPEVKLARRYETSLHNRLKWCVAQLKEPTPIGLEGLTSTPVAEVAEVEAEAEVEPEPSGLRDEPITAAGRTQHDASGRTQDAPQDSSRHPLISRNELAEAVFLTYARCPVGRDPAKDQKSI
jgi:hypothetical protein